MIVLCVIIFHARYNMYVLCLSTVFMKRVCMCGRRRRRTPGLDGARTLRNNDSPFMA